MRPIKNPDVLTIYENYEEKYRTPLLKIRELSMKGKIYLFWDGNWWLSLNVAMWIVNSGCLDNE